MTKEEIKTMIEDTLEEIHELQFNQHTSFYRDEPRGRERQAMLLLKLNALEELEDAMEPKHRVYSPC